MIPTLQDLFAFVLRHEFTFVFGNLGRKPHLIYQFLAEELPGVNVAIVSPFYSFPTSGDHRIRTIEPSSASTVKCDLLIYAEPMPYTRLGDKPEGVGRSVVLCSHLMLQDNVRPTMVAYFECLSVADTIQKTRRLQTLQDGSVQTNNVNHIKSPLRVQVIDPSTASLEHPDTFAVIDLTHHTSPIRLYLSFWDAFDVLLRHVECVGRWVIAFPERHGAKVFEQLAQDVIDKLYCLKFEHGNVSSRSNHLLSLMPFYKSGVVDPQSFDVATDTFCGLEYTAPDSAEDVFKAGAKFNLEHWVGSVYRLR